MYTSCVSVLLYGLIGTSLAFKTPSEPHYSPIERRCEQRNVYFHFNDSTLGVIPSCSWDVSSLAASPILGSTVARSYSISSRQNCPPGTCTDGVTTNYTVKAGDTVEMIAAMFDSGVCDISKANNLASPDFILVGQQLVVPTKLCKPDNNSCRTPPGTRPCVPRAEGVPKTYTIKSGDTFFLIGTRLNITADSLVAANLCVDPGALQIGQVIKIPICPNCSKHDE